ncbi:hypothetical protein [Acinetobacter stercoris]|uniref:hypothetical protein n=1 Tax=Acinetobacter stercoris TaxID=2126983 RepID=UPI0011B28A2C|nr:hypothetical protein [Acinetobacter stercoris]
MSHFQDKFTSKNTTLSLNERNFSVQKSTVYALDTIAVFTGKQILVTLNWTTFDYAQHKKALVTFLA